MIYANDCSIRVVRSYAKEIFVQVLAYENYFTTKKKRKLRYIHMKKIIVQEIVWVAILKDSRHQHPSYRPFSTLRYFAQRFIIAITSRLSGDEKPCW